MILEALNRLAVQEELMEDPDYEFRPVAWLVRVDEGGVLLGIEGTHSTPEPQGKKKPKPQAKSIPVPRQPGRTSGDRAFFLCDKAEYALGVDPTPEGEKRRPADKVAVRFGLFRAQVSACLEATRDEGVQAVHVLLERIAAGEEAVRVPGECTSNDLFAFVYAPDLERPVHARPAVRAYWQAQRRASEGEATGDLRCLVTGAPMGEPGLFPMLKRVPGGNTAGVALVSFNSGAFESYGWKGNENAPISRQAAEAATTALNRLLHPAFPDPRPEHLGETLPSRNVRLTADTVVCFWASDRAADAFLNVLGGLLEGSDPAKVGEAYRSIWKGRPVKIDDPSEFYALTLSGAQGRAVVRDWFESSVADVVRSLAEYFEDLAVVRNTPPPKGKEPSPHVPLRALLGSLAPMGRSDAIPAPLAAGLVKAGLRGTPFPLAVLLKALERTRAEIGRSDWADLERRDARAALIKAVLRRNFPHKELTPDMDPQNNEPGYLLGRLMAVLERLQQVALGVDVNATVVDRFFGAASATPQAVFPRLLKNARHHARKATDDPRAGGAGMWLDRQIDDILSRLGVQKNRTGVPFTGFPTHLALEQQGLFVLGYHHQRHWLWMKKEDRERIQAERTRATAAAV